MSRIFVFVCISFKPTAHGELLVELLVELSAELTGTSNILLSR